MHTASFVNTIGTKTSPQAEGRSYIEGGYKQGAQGNN